MSIKINKNGKEYDLGFVPQSLYDDVANLKEIIKKKTFTTSTDGNKIAETGLTTANAIPISVDCIGCTCYIGTTYQGRWFATFYDYGTGNMISVTNKEITVYYIDLTKISVQS